jgi:L-ascorbate metabolism protein UlaG (beta-lactamase superfamily)
MKVGVEWFGHAAFRLSGGGATVVLDPDHNGLEALAGARAVIRSTAGRFDSPIGAGSAIGIVRRLAPTWVVPMHYRTAALDLLETAAPFLAKLDGRRQLCPSGSTFELDPDELGSTAPTVVLPKAPGG